MHTRVHQYSSREQVSVPNVIALVGLPARGKTYISYKLCRYLNWIGIKTKAFNVGEYRRRACNLDEQGAADFFNPKNVQGSRIRDECAKLAMNDMEQYLEKKEGEVAIFDATNTTRERRRWLVQFCKKKEREPKFRIFFIESVCDDPDIINSNIAEVKISSPDYKDRMTDEQAREDFLKRIENYKLQYEPLDEEYDDELSYIKVSNAGRSFYVHNVNGHVQSRVVYFLMNIHLLPRSIYLTRHGESEYNRIGRLGGDSPLSENGIQYARKLRDYFESENIPGDLRIWSSQKIRAAQSANMIKDLAAHVEYWKVLDEIDAGICEGLTYEDFQARYPKQFLERDKDKYHYRYPSGESYEDLVARLEPVIMELERQSNVLVVSHQAVLRCILAYFDNKNRDELPYLNVPLHTVIKLTPKAYSCQIEMYKFRIDAVDTYRAKPNEPSIPKFQTFKLLVKNENDKIYEDLINDKNDSNLVLTKKLSSLSAPSISNLPLSTESLPLQKIKSLNSNTTKNEENLENNLKDLLLHKNENKITSANIKLLETSNLNTNLVTKEENIDNKNTINLKNKTAPTVVAVAALSATSQILNSNGILEEYHTPRCVATGNSQN